MLDDSTTDLARKSIEVALKERWGPLSVQSGQIISDATKHGAYGGSRMLLGIIALYRSELDIQASIAWLQLKRVLATVGISHTETLSSELRAFMKEIIEGLTANLMEHIGSSRPFNKDVTGHVDPTKQLEDAKAHALNKVGCEIDLYTAGLERAMRDAQQHRPTSVNVHGPVGILQTGDYSTASMTITLDDTSKKEIVTALETVEAAIRDLQDTPFDKAELLELIRESKAEASEHQPKTTRLKGFLLGIATSIQSVAALRPAYETLKGALALIGVPLA